MFDNNQNTFWRSNDQHRLENKIIGVEFKVIFFLTLSPFESPFEIDNEIVLQSDQNMMKPQMKTSHEFIGILLS